MTNEKKQAELIKEISGVNPLKCILCGTREHRRTGKFQISVEMPLLLCLCRALSERCKTG